MDSKPWYQSKTMWGAILAILAPVIGQLLHHSFSDTDIQSGADAFAAIGSGIGGIVAIYGRTKATTAITATTPPKG